MKNIILMGISLFMSLLATAQDKSKSDSTVSTYFHISQLSRGYGGVSRGEVISFKLKNIDSLGKPNWESKEITDIEREEAGYLVKADVPLSLIGNSRQMWCTATLIRNNDRDRDTFKTDYGGVKLSTIKLILKSTPEGAETFLIPNRIWARDFGDATFEENNSQLQKFRVNTSSTNTYAFVDQTVFVVIFKMNGVVKEIVHRTRPYSIEKEQTVWINF